MIKDFIPSHSHIELKSAFEHKGSSPLSQEQGEARREVKPPLTFLGDPAPHKK